MSENLWVKIREEEEKPIDQIVSQISYEKVLYLLEYTLNKLS